MALISASTFDPLARFVNVRLQQGVPIVDADINELDDIRAFELRAFLKWFVGDGVPDGNDGFRLEGTGAANDFAIRAGRQSAELDDPTERALRRVGRIIVDGLDVIIDADTTFAGQALHAGRFGSDRLASRLAVPVVPALSTPATDGTVAAYLDVWESLVTADDEDRLLHQGLGVETCARLRREWAVRVRAGAGAPQPGQDDFVAGHSYSLLGVITRRANDPVVRPDDIADRRHQRLQLTPATLVEDVLGTTVDVYRTGQRRPPVSLRDALNAVMHGELPTTEVIPVAPGGPGAVDDIGRAFLNDRRGGVVAVFTSDRAGTQQVYASRMDLAAAERSFGTPVQVTRTTAHSKPSVAELPDGSLFIAYQSQAGTNADIAFKRGRLADLSSTEADEVVAATALMPETAPCVVASGWIVTVFFHKAESVAAPGTWHYRRLRADTGVWLDELAVELDGEDASRDLFHAALASDGTIWAAFATDSGVNAIQLDPTNGRPGTKTKIGDRVENAQWAPFVLGLRGGGAYVVWHNNGLRVNHIQREPSLAATMQVTQVQETAPPKPCAVQDADGLIWLVWRRTGVIEDELVCMRRNELGVWGEPRVLVRGPVDPSPIAVAGSDTTVSVFWSDTRDERPQIFTKRFVSAV